MSKKLYIVGNHSYLLLKKFGRVEKDSSILVHQGNTLKSYHQVKLEYFSECNSIVAVGGGGVIDYSKYVASKLNLHLKVIPTILSTDAMFTSVSIIRCPEVVYICTKVPEEVELDYVLLEDVDWRYHVGTGDVLSIITALRCWRKFPTYDEDVAKEAMLIVDSLKRPDTKVGIERLFKCLKDEVTLCERVGTSQVEEGIEHDFAYCFEKYTTSRRVLHGELVAGGIVCAAKVLNMSVKDLDSIKERFCDLGLMWRPSELKLNLPRFFELMLR